MATRYVPEKIVINCTKCGEEIDEGFLCRERALILCLICHENFNMSRCPHTHNEHQHIRWPGFQNKNIDFMNQVKKISDGNKTQQRAAL